MNEIIDLLLCVAAASLFFAVLGGIADLICKGVDDDDE